MQVVKLTETFLFFVVINACWCTSKCFSDPVVQMEPNFSWGTSRRCKYSFVIFACFTEVQRLFSQPPPLHAAPSGATASSLLVCLFDLFGAHSWEDGQLRLELCLVNAMRHPTVEKEGRKLLDRFFNVVRGEIPAHFYCPLSVQTYSARPHSIQNLSDFQWQWSLQWEIVDIHWERHVLLSLDSLNLFLLKITMGPVHG